MRQGRRTQVVKGAVCKTAMQRFDPARRLHPHLYVVCLVHLAYRVCLVYRVGLVQPNKQDKLNKPNNGLLTLAEGLPGRASVGPRS